jgi:hypothetical protein
MRYLGVILFVTLAALGGSPVVAQGTGDDVAEAAAVEQALAVTEAWLALVDEGEYRKSWETAAELFRNAVALEQWEQSLQAARRPLGALISRKPKTKHFTTSMPGAPDGEYVVFQFDTVFENKSSAVETVTPMRDPDGKWRVSGYYVK